MLKSNNVASSEYDAIKAKLADLSDTYKRLFPKAWPDLVEELVPQSAHSGDNGNRMYSLQVITKGNT